MARRLPFGTGIIIIIVFDMFNKTSNKNRPQYNDNGPPTISHTFARWAYAHTQ